MGYLDRQRSRAEENTSDPRIEAENQKQQDQSNSASRLAVCLLPLWKKIQDRKSIESPFEEQPFPNFYCNSL
ncbi:hypothetical protein MHBO_002051 [Bonamia ostreae]|uniref:Uncharacterized protein n=1 Tax=Bonamia ostreae TaxID=126728 RepID=A0ABV2AL28_9EUKA